MNATADQPLPTSQDAQDEKIEALQGEVSELKELVAAQNSQIAMLIEKYIVILFFIFFVNEFTSYEPNYRLL